MKSFWAVNKGAVVGLAMLMGFGVVGCGDDPGTGLPGEGPATNGGGGGGGGNPPVTPAPGSRILALEGPNQVELRPSAGTDIAFVLKTSTNDVLIGETIDFATIGDVAGSSIAAQQVLTGAGGRAVLHLQAGASAAQFQLKASAAGANDVFVNIKVASDPFGTLDVTVSYVQEYGVLLATGKVSLLPPQKTCAMIQSTPTDLGTPIRTADLTSFPSTAQFNSLGAGSTFTVVAQGFRQASGLTAHGCVDNVSVPSGQTTTLAIQLHVIALNPLGTYTVDTDYNFTGIFQSMGTFGTVFTEITNAFDDPDDPYLYVAQKVANAIGLGSGTATVLAPIIRQALEPILPSWFQKFVTVARDITSYLTKFHVISKLELSKLASQLTLSGKNSWEKIVVYWRFNCAQGAPPDCGRREIGILSSGISPVEGSFTAAVENYNQLKINQHTVPIAYGQIVMALLNDLLWPALTNGVAHNLGEALQALVNCSSISTRIAASSLGQSLGLTAQSFTQVCTSALQAVAVMIESRINALSLDGVLGFSGTATMLETTGDLLVDKFDPGQFNGSLTFGSSQPRNFTGTWTATRRNP
ncbi:MAG: hypothetical protein HYY84_07465 [Deltaproteobacteria bacterium]|nr:hypothetical protein [Deltaproteobacteria bacterium]